MRGGFAVWRGFEDLGDLREVGCALAYVEHPIRPDHQEIVPGDEFAALDVCFRDEPFFQLRVSERARHRDAPAHTVRPLHIRHLPACRLDARDFHRIAGLVGRGHGDVTPTFENLARLHATEDVRGGVSDIGDEEVHASNDRDAACRAVLPPLRYRLGAEGVVRVAERAREQLLRLHLLEAGAGAVREMLREVVHHVLGAALPGVTVEDAEGVVLRMAEDAVLVALLPARDGRAVPAGEGGGARREPALEVVVVVRLRGHDEGESWLASPWSFRSLLPKALVAGWPWGAAMHEIRTASGGRACLDLSYLVIVNLEFAYPCWPLLLKRNPLCGILGSRPLPVG
mmetsp:Transcript_15834/g.38201  ORF Transcript_15834/g.38201 Transcript_15834/m.38201 type:complete len:342 (-) Transcript_15834:68-1093(-)